MKYADERSLLNSATIFSVGDPEEGIFLYVDSNLPIVKIRSPDWFPIYWVPTPVKVVFAIETYTVLILYVKLSTGLNEIFISDPS